MKVGSGMHARKKIAIVARWKASGLSQAEYCRREGLQQWQLSEWKRFVEARDRQGQDAAANRAVEADANILPEANAAVRRRGRRARAADVVQPPPFVPVRLVEEAADDGGECRVPNDSPYVLEVVLDRGQVIRVAAHCEPQFLSAIISAINC